jgi:Family of unknown function (DUF5995)
MSWWETRSSPAAQGLPDGVLDDSLRAIASGEGPDRGRLVHLARAWSRPERADTRLRYLFPDLYAPARQLPRDLRSTAAAVTADALPGLAVSGRGSAALLPQVATGGDQVNVPSLPADSPITSVDEAITRMEALDKALPAQDGLACFNRLYIGVMQQIAQRLSSGFFTDPAAMTHLDIVFASLYFAAADAGQPSSAPCAWQPLLDHRADPGIEPVQFALAGMNTHISHDLPIAIATTCADLSFPPTATVFRTDYEKVDQVLDAAEQSARESFESGAVLAADEHARAVINLLANWDLNQAREIAWDTALALWETRELPVARDLLLASLGRTVAATSQLLLVAL